MKIVSSTWDDDVEYKIFVYAANGNGKTDIKAIVVNSKYFDAELAIAEAEIAPAAGGEFSFDVLCDEEFVITTDAEWLTAVETKAQYEWHGTINAEKNETNWYRSAHVTVSNLYDDPIKQFEVIQAPADEIATSINAIKYQTEDGKENVIANNLTVVAAGAIGILVTDGSGAFMPILMKEGEAIPEVGKVYNFVGTVSLIIDETEHSD